MSGIGHNNGPALEREVSIRTRWAKALFADPTTPPYVMAIAWAVHWYSDAEGKGAALSNKQLETICGISTSTATRGKAWLRDKGYVQLKIGTGDEKTRFQLIIPVCETRVVTETRVVREKGGRADGAVIVTMGGGQADHPGVVTETTNIQERDSGSNQDKKRTEQRSNLWQEALNPQAHDVLFENGKVTLLNGERASWLAQFEGDERGLDLALIEIAPYLQPNSNRPLKAQVASQLARRVSEKRDKDSRYAKAAARQQATGPPRQQATEHWSDKRRRENSELLKRMREES